MDISHSDGASTSREEHIQQLSKVAENIIEVEVDFNEKIGKNGVNLDKTGFPEVLNAEFALRNTNGGIIKLKMKTKLSPENKIEKIDQWLSNLNDKRHDKLKELGLKEIPSKIIDFKPEEMLLFVKKSSIVLTEKSNLLVRRFNQKYELQNYFEIQNLLVTNDEPRCCCSNGPPIDSFIKGQQIPFGESTTVEYKQLTSKNLPDKLRDVLGEYIVQFANTCGGYVYFGITDAAIIKGQRVNEKEMHPIEHKVQCCMETKFWINKSGEKKIPERGNHYEVTFFPVNEADERTFVIQVHICQYAGTVFLKEPECKVVDDNNQIVNMGFERWLASFLKSVKTVKGNSVYQGKFEERKCGTSTYYSVKDTVKTFVAGVTSASPGQLKLHPTHAVDWIQHPALNKFIDTARKIFQKNKWQSGIAYIERCWEVNLGLPSTKPDNVICDVLLCSPQMPLVFVSLTQSNIPDDEASSSYNRKVAAKLKATLAQDADCLEKFYVKPVVISHEQLEVSEDASCIYSETPLYPETYRMNNDKYQKVLEALVLVLARANVMASHIVGQGLFNLLTYEQYDILHEFYEKSPKVKITGPPGSGKTVLAIERIRRLRNTGCSYDEVLFLCSDLPLKARVENVKIHGQPLCIAMTYYELDCLVQLDVEFNNKLGKLKHILADEAQNFKKVDTSHDLWSKLHALCDDRSDSSFWVFFDLAQKINNSRPVSLWRFSEKKLKTVIRQTCKVHTFIKSKYTGVDPEVKLGHDFDGPEIDVLVPNRSNTNCSMQLHLTDILISELEKLIIKDGHHINDITVLFSDSKQKNFYQKLFVERTEYRYPVRNGEEVSENGVVFDIIRRYCGVDANIVIGFCPKYYTSGFQNDNALMTALCSRTKFRLILIFKNEDEAGHFHVAQAELKFV